MPLLDGFLINGGFLGHNWASLDPTWPQHVLRDVSTPLTLGTLAEVPIPENFVHDVNH